MLAALLCSLDIRSGTHMGQQFSRPAHLYAKSYQPSGPVHDILTRHQQTRNDGNKPDNKLTGHTMRKGEPVLMD